MTTSETINELATALSKAQAEMAGAKKDSTNPHFRSSYADLASVREACWGPLTKHGLSVVQSPRLVAAGDGLWVLELETRLLHTSGQWIADTAATPLSKADAQGVGSATTYLRRYALAAFAGIAPEDDDGNAASASNGHTKAAAAPKKPVDYNSWVDSLNVQATFGTDALREAWKRSPVECRNYMNTYARDVWDGIKAKAEQANAVTA